MEHIMNSMLLAQVLVNGLSLSAIYILIALGFTLLFGIMRVVNFAHGEFAMLGGFGLYYLYGYFGVPWLPAILLSATAVATVSLILETLVFRWFYQRMFQSMIGLMGLSMAMMYTSVLIWDVQERNIPAAFGTVMNVGKIIVPTDRLAIIGIAGAALVVFYVFIQHTRYGLAIRGAGADLEAAQIQGVDVKPMYRMAFFVAIFLTALAGALFTQTYVLSPFAGERPLMVAFIVSVLGGMGSIPGAALGGLILGFAESIVGTYFGSAEASFVTFGAVILLLIFRPWGLLGRPD